MVDQEIVCCMCGDIGFADKLFQCSCCRFRFQHLYCSSYNYGNHEISSSSSTSMICDWCQSEGRNSSTSTTKSFKRSSSSLSMDHHHHRTNNLHIRKQHHHHHQDHHIITTNNDDNENTTSGVVPSPRGTSKNNSNNSGVPSPRTGVHRRYKLLKDVMC